MRINFVSRGGDDGRRDKHDGKARPLSPNLSDSQQARETFKMAEFRAAGKVGLAGRECDDVGEGAGAGGGPKEDVVRGDSLRRAAGDDTMVLREVGYEDAEEDESWRRNEGQFSCV